MEGKHSMWKVLLFMLHKLLSLHTHDVLHIIKRPVADCCFYYCRWKRDPENPNSQVDAK